MMGNMDNPNTENTTEKPEFCVEAVRVLLSLARSEYEYEQNRISVIDSKTSIALPIASGYCLALVQMAGVKRVLEVNIHSFLDILVPVFAVVIYLASLAFSLASVVMMVKVITTREYSTINAGDLYDEDYLKYNEIALEIQLILLYIEATQKNSYENELRIPLYRSGWQSMIFSVVLFFVYVAIRGVCF